MRTDSAVYRTTRIADGTASNDCPGPALMTADCKRPYNVQASERRKMKKVLGVCRVYGGVLRAWSVPDIWPDEIPAE